MNADNVNLVSDGDIRLTGTYNVSNSPGVTSNGFGGIPVAGAFLVADNLDITAREGLSDHWDRIPVDVAGACAVRRLRYARHHHFRLKRRNPGDAGFRRVAPSSSMPTPSCRAGRCTRRSAPSSSASVPDKRCRGLFTVFGSSSDPYDPVEFGQSFGLFGHNLTTVATDSVTLTAGSLTSVSADGLMIPYGTTTDGINWTFNNTLLNGPPVKAAVAGRCQGRDADRRGDRRQRRRRCLCHRVRARHRRLAQRPHHLGADRLRAGSGLQLGARGFDPSFSTEVAAGQTVTIGGGPAFRPAPIRCCGRVRDASRRLSRRRVRHQCQFTDQAVHHCGRLGLHDRRVRQRDQRHARVADRAIAEFSRNAVWTKYSESTSPRGRLISPRLPPATAPPCRGLHRMRRVSSSPRAPRSCSTAPISLPPPRAASAASSTLPAPTSSSRAAISLISSARW